MRLHRGYTGKFTVMLRITRILDKTISGFIRKFKTTLYGSDALYLEQFHSGGDDYNPPKNIKALSSFLGNNPRDGVIFLFRDDTERKSASGEKRIYATDAAGKIVVAEIHLKNDGTIQVDCNRFVLNCIGDVEFNSGAGITLNSACTKVTGNLSSDMGGSSIVMSAGDTLTVTCGLIDKKG